MKESQEEFNKLAEIRGEEKIQMAVRVGKADPAYEPYRKSFNSFSRWLRLSHPSNGASIKGTIFFVLA
jgi:hypothetical protein